MASVPPDPTKHGSRQDTTTTITTTTTTTTSTEQPLQPITVPLLQPDQTMSDTYKHQHRVPCIVTTSADASDDSSKGAVMLVAGGTLASSSASTTASVATAEGGGVGRSVSLEAATTAAAATAAVAAVVACTSLSPSVSTAAARTTTTTAVSVLRPSPSSSLATTPMLSMRRGDADRSPTTTSPSAMTPMPMMPTSASVGSSLQQQRTSRADQVEVQRSSTSSDQTSPKRNSAHIMEFFQEQEKSFQEHFRTLPVPVKDKNRRSPSPSMMRQSVGLDHLDNLVRLMEQLTTLRDENNRLKKKCAYLESTKFLLQARSEMSEDEAPLGYMSLPSKSKQKQQKAMRDSSEAVFPATASDSPRQRLSSGDSSQIIEIIETASDQTPKRPKTAKLYKRSFSTGSLEIPFDVLEQDNTEQMTTRVIVSDYNGKDSKSGSKSPGSKKKSCKFSKWARVKKILTGQKTMTTDDFETTTMTTTMPTTPTTPIMRKSLKDGGKASSQLLARQSQTSAQELTVPIVGLTETRSMDSGVSSGVDGDGREGGVRTSTSSGGPPSPSALTKDALTDPLDTGAEWWRWSDKSRQAGVGKAPDSRVQYLNVKGLVRRQSSPSLVAEGGEGSDKTIGGDRSSPRLHRSSSYKIPGKSGEEPGSRERKIHKSAWGRMKGMIHTKKDSVKKKQKKYDKTFPPEERSETDTETELYSSSSPKLSSEKSNKKQLKTASSDSKAGTPQISPSLFHQRSSVRSSGSESSKSKHSSAKKKLPQTGKVDVEALVGGMTEDFTKKLRQWEELKCMHATGYSKGPVELSAASIQQVQRESTKKTVEWEHSKSKGPSLKLKWESDSLGDKDKATTSPALSLSPSLSMSPSPIPSPSPLSSSPLDTKMTITTTTTKASKTTISSTSSFSSTGTSVTTPKTPGSGAGIIGALSMGTSSTSTSPAMTPSPVNVDELQRNLTESFSRKIQEWESIKYRKEGSPLLSSSSSRGTRKEGKSKLKKSKSEKEKDKEKERSFKSDKSKGKEKDGAGGEKSSTTSSKKGSAAHPTATSAAVGVTAAAAATAAAATSVSVGAAVAATAAVSEKHTHHHHKGGSKSGEKSRWRHHAASRVRFEGGGAEFDPKLASTMLAPLTEYKITDEFARKLYEWEEMKGLSHELSAAVFQVCSASISAPPTPRQQQQQEQSLPPPLQQQQQQSSPSVHPRKSAVAPTTTTTTARSTTTAAHMTAMMSTSTTTTAATTSTTTTTTTKTSTSTFNLTTPITTTTTTGTSLLGSGTTTTAAKTTDVTTASTIAAATTTTTTSTTSTAAAATTAAAVAVSATPIEEGKVEKGVGGKAIQKHKPSPLNLSYSWVESPDEASPVDRFFVDDSSSETSYEESATTDQSMTKSNIMSLENAHHRLLHDLENKKQEYENVQESVRRLHSKLEKFKDAHSKEIVRFRKEILLGKKSSGKLKEQDSGTLYTTLQQLEGKIQELENSGEKLQLSMESAAMCKLLSMEGEENISSRLVELMEQMKFMLAKASQEEEMSKKSSALSNFEKFYCHAMQLQIQMNNLRLSHLERNKEIMEMKRQLLLQEVNNLLLQADITRRESELYQFQEARRTSQLKRWNTYHGGRTEQRPRVASRRDRDTETSSPPFHRFVSMKERNNQEIYLDSDRQSTMLETTLPDTFEQDGLKHSHVGSLTDVRFDPTSPLIHLNGSSPQLPYRSRSTPFMDSLGPSMDQSPVRMAPEGETHRASFISTLSPSDPELLSRVPDGASQEIEPITSGTPATISHGIQDESDPSRLQISFTISLPTRNVQIPQAVATSSHETGSISSQCILCRTASVQRQAKGSATATTTTTTDVGVEPTTEGLKADVSSEQIGRFHQGETLADWLKREPKCPDLLLPECCHSKDFLVAQQALLSEELPAEASALEMGEGRPHTESSPQIKPIVSKSKAAPQTYTTSPPTVVKKQSSPKVPQVTDQILPGESESVLLSSEKKQTHPEDRKPKSSKSPKPEKHGVFPESPVLKLSQTAYPPQVGVVSPIRRLKPATELLEECQKYRLGHLAYHTRGYLRGARIDDPGKKVTEEMSSKRLEKENISEDYVEVVAKRLSAEGMPAQHDGSSETTPPAGSVISLQTSESPRTQTKLGHRNLHDVSSRQADLRRTRQKPPVPSSSTDMAGAQAPPTRLSDPVKGQDSPSHADPAVSYRKTSDRVQDGAQSARRRSLEVPKPGDSQIDLQPYSRSSMNLDDRATKEGKPDSTMSASNSFSLPVLSSGEAQRNGATSRSHTCSALTDISSDDPNKPTSQQPSSERIGGVPSSEIDSSSFRQVGSSIFYVASAASLESSLPDVSESGLEKSSKKKGQKRKLRAKFSSRPASVSPPPSQPHSPTSPLPPQQPPPPQPLQEQQPSSSRGTGKRKKGTIGELCMQSMSFNLGITPGTSSPRGSTGKEGDDIEDTDIQPEEEGATACREPLDTEEGTISEDEDSSSSAQLGDRRKPRGRFFDSNWFSKSKKLFKASK
ncbi:uncharacterized protein LOC115223384 [Argonauta hians]